MASHHPHSILQLQKIVLEKTNGQIWNLVIEILPERIVLRGITTTFYAKQLAQEGIRKMLPEVRLENSIEVAA